MDPILPRTTISHCDLKHLQCFYTHLAISHAASLCKHGDDIEDAADDSDNKNGNDNDGTDDDEEKSGHSQNNFCAI